MKPAYIPLFAAFLCLPLRAQAQTTQQSASTEALRANVQKIMLQCDDTRPGGGSDPSWCYIQHLSNGADAAQHRNWNKTIVEETDSIEIRTIYLRQLSSLFNLRPRPGINSSTAPYIIRSIAYEGAKQYNLAIDDLTAAIAIDPHDPTSWNDRCWNRAITGNLTDALQDCQKALQLAPKSAYVLDSTGFVYLKMKNYSEAIAQYQEALKYNPKLASSLYGLGLAEQASCNPAQAAQHIAAAQKLDPKITTDFGT